MAEKIISPGVFTNEIDQTFLPAAVADIGAAIIGPTLKGPAGIPTIVTSFSDFQAKFGDAFKSGSNSQQYLTSHAAEQYLKDSNTLTVVRVMDGTFAPATASIATTGSVDGAASTFASMSILFNSNPTGSVTGGGDEISIGGVDFTFVSSSANLNNSSTQIFVPFGIGNVNADVAGFIKSGSQNLVDAINNSSSLHGLDINAARGAGAAVNNDSQVLIISSSATGLNANIAISTGSFTTAEAPFLFTETDLSTAFATADNPTTLQGGTDGAKGISFTLKTLADGTIMNNTDTIATTNSVLVSGSKHNIRFEVSNKKTNTRNIY